jgi:hypothetical protein
MSAGANKAAHSFHAADDCGRDPRTVRARTRPTILLPAEMGRGVERLESGDTSLPAQVLGAHPSREKYPLSVKRLFGSEQGKVREVLANRYTPIATPEAAYRAAGRSSRSQSRPAKRSLNQGRTHRENRRTAERAPEVAAPDVTDKQLTGRRRSEEPNRLRNPDPPALSGHSRRRPPSRSCINAPLSWTSGLTLTSRQTPRFAPATNSFRARTEWATPRRPQTRCSSQKQAS